MLNRRGVFVCLRKKTRGCLPGDAVAWRTHAPHARTYARMHACTLTLRGRSSKILHEHRRRGQLAIDADELRPARRVDGDVESSSCVHGRGATGLDPVEEHTRPRQLQLRARVARGTRSAAPTPPRNECVHGGQQRRFGCSSSNNSSSSSRTTPHDAHTTTRTPHSHARVPVHRPPARADAAAAASEYKRTRSATV